MESRHEQVEKWLNSLVIEGKSTNTCSAYRRDLHNFMLFCSERDLDIVDVETSDLREYIGYRVTQCNLSNPSIRREVTAIRQFMQWLVVLKQLVVNAATEVVLKKQPAKLPHILDIETVNRLIDQPPPNSLIQQDLWARDKAMLEVFYSSGVRLSELRNLKFNDVDFSRKLLRVTGKGDKTRIVPIGSRALESLRNYFPVYIKWAGEIDKQDYIFITRKKTHITRIQIYSRVEFQAKRAGLEQHVYPHLLRHCFATHLLSNSQDLRSVQEMLGHTNISTTQVYTHLDFDMLASQYDKAHQRASRN